jgi:DNA-entry nuclease
MKKHFFVLLFIIIFLFTGCSSSEKIISNVEAPDNIDLSIEQETSEDNNTFSIEEDTSSSFILSEIPEYSGSPYIEVNDNIPYFSENEKVNTNVFETYSNLDSLGRCGVAYANICQELMPTEERGEIGQIKPTGWHTVNYHELVDGNYLYNRCHLIAFCLAGENANEKNLITGTRYMNVQGMLPFEEKVANFVDNTNYHVLYRVTPIFEGDNLVASGVEMEAYSVEDNGAGICFHVYCYNVQPGITIDYATGDSWVTNSEQTIGSSIDNITDSVETTYVINKNTKKFHLPTCDSVTQMKESNKEYSPKTKEQLEEEGYVACQNCL